MATATKNNDDRARSLTFQFMRHNLATIIDDPSETRLGIRIYDALTVLNVLATAFVLPRSLLVNLCGLHVAAILFICLLGCWLNYLSRFLGVFSELFIIIVGTIAH